jgi:vacuolar protein sorting-associated protein 13A/C
VHVVELSHLLLLSINMQDTEFRQSEFSVINSNSKEEFGRESNLVVKDSRGVELNLKLHYL